MTRYYLFTKALNGDLLENVDPVNNKSTRKYSRSYFIVRDSHKYFKGLTIDRLSKRMVIKRSLQSVSCRIYPET